MDSQRFDAIVRGLAAGVSRRRVLARLAAAAAGGPLALLGAESARGQGKDKDKDKNKDAPGGGPSCREAGHPCEGNQVCCPGLECRVTGPGNAARCAAPGAAGAGCEGDCPEVCEGDCPEVEAVEVVEVERVCEGECPPASEALVAPAPAYRVAVECAYEAAADRTTCTCAGVAEGAVAAVRRVILPPADVCAEVVGGDFAVATAGTGGQANAEASGGAVVVQGGDQVDVDASGGQAVAQAGGGAGNVAVVAGRGTGYASTGDGGTLTLTLAGRVTTGATATYWCETASGLVPAPGPALVRAPEEDPDAGEVVVQASACDAAEAPADFDWYGRCRRAAAGTEFALAAWSGAGAGEPSSGATDEGGRLRFGPLRAGTYRLTPAGAAWCHATSDSVDAEGNVVVEAGRRATVWVFTCGEGTTPAK